MTDIFSCGPVSCNDACSNPDKKGDGMAPHLPATRRPEHKRDIAYSIVRNDSSSAESAVEGGLGLVMEVRELDFWGPSLMVSIVKAGGPADGKGILPGDILYSVNQVRTAGRQPDEIISLLKGGAGTTVRLQFERAGMHEANKVAHPSNLKICEIVRAKTERVEKGGGSHLTEVDLEESVERMVCLGTYHAPARAESSGFSVILSAEAGEVVSIITHGARGWTTIEKSDGSIGWFPSSYLGLAQSNQAAAGAWAGGPPIAVRARRDSAYSEQGGGDRAGKVTFSKANDSANL